MSDALAGMIQALGSEVSAIRRKGGGTRIDLRGGERVGVREGHWLYRFVLVDDLNLRDDTPVRVIAGKDNVLGALVSFKDGVLLVALEKDLGPKIAIARLITDDAFLVERLKERLEKIQRGEANINREIADRVLGLVRIRTDTEEPHPLVLRSAEAKCPRDLNPEQVAAVRHSLGSDVTFVWGPPGTGKTMTLARIVEAHYRVGRSVLLVSNTNIAVDTALEKIVERLREEPDFTRGLVLRQGPLVKEELCMRLGPNVILEEIVVRLGEKLTKEKSDLRRQMADQTREVRDLERVLERFEKLASVRQRLADCNRACNAKRGEIASRQREAQEQHYRVRRLKSDLQRAQSMGTLRRIFSGLNPERLLHEIAGAEAAARAATDAAKAVSSEISVLRTEMASLHKEVERLAAATRGYAPAAQLKDRLGTSKRQLAIIENRVAAVERALAEIERQVLAGCRVLATTVYRTYLGNGLHRSFDVVIVDEASMLMPPLVYYAAGLAGRSVTVAGDFRQLPPIVTSDQPLAKDWLECDVFEKAGIPHQLKNRQKPLFLIALGEQYRMRQPICEVINNLFYEDHRLRSHESTNRGNSGFPLSEAALLYVDTGSYHPWSAFRAGSYSRYNLFHALLIRNIVRHVANNWHAWSKDAIGVVAPYAAQARLVQALLEDALGRGDAAGMAATVHRFQGNEKKAMIVDLTDSYGTLLGRFMKATAMEDAGARLLNVAVSRARDHVVLVANFEWLRSKIPPKGFTRRLLEHFQQHAKMLHIDELLPLGERDWIDALHPPFGSTFDLPEGAAGIFTEGTFYPAFLSDIDRASDSIVILSPFATARGTARWVEHFRAAMARGVSVHVLTCPPKAFGGRTAKEVEQLIGRLRGLGVRVDLRHHMHEKIAILDGRILWHGSLNVLSHNRTYESMLRIESPKACERLSRFWSPPSGGRSDDDTATVAVPANPACPLCGGPTVWKTGKFGVWSTCEDPGCHGKTDFHQVARAKSRGLRKTVRDNTI